MDFFDGLTVVVTASNEREALRQTILSVLQYCDPKDLSEIVVFLKSKDCPSALELPTILLELDNSVSVRSYIQKDPAALRAMAEIPSLIHSSHFLILFADMEADPASIPEMIRIAKQKPNAIICATKLHRDSVRIGYGRVRRFLSCSVNAIAAALVRSDCKDLFSVYQVYPLELIHRFHIDVPGKILFEYTLKPVSQGVEYIEIPTKYVKRSDGKSSFPFFRVCFIGVRFLLTAVKLRIKR